MFMKVMKKMGERGVVPGAPDAVMQEIRDEVSKERDPEERLPTVFDKVVADLLAKGQDDFGYTAGPICAIDDDCENNPETWPELLANVEFIHNQCAG